MNYKFTALFIALIMSATIFGVNVSAKVIDISNPYNSNESVESSSGCLNIATAKVKQKFTYDDITPQPGYLQTAIYFIYGRVSNFYQDDEVISFHAESVILREFMFVLVPLYFGKIKIPFPLFDHLINFISDTDIKIVKDDYIYQNYRFYNKESFLIGIATYYEN